MLKTYNQLFNSRNLFLLLVSIFLYQEISAKASISFVVHYPKAKTITISSIKDVISEEVWSKEIEIEDGKMYHCSWDMQSPKMVKFTHDDRSYEFYVEPNDSLVLDIDGIQFPNEMTMEGRGQMQNLLLYNIQQPFSLLGRKQMLTKLYRSNSIDYRTFVDHIYEQKWALANQLFNQFHGQYTSEFHQYVESKLNYWRAFYLMEFYNQHKTSFSNIVYEVTEEYYNFLNDVYINNESALAIEEYRGFIKIYEDFRTKKVDFKYGIPSRQQLLEVTADEIPLYSNESCTKVIAALPLNTKLLVKEALSYANKPENIYLIKVKTLDEREGWCKMNGLVQVQQTFTSVNELTLTMFKKNYKSNSSELTLTTDSIPMFADPDDQLFSKIKCIYAGETAIPLNEKTSKRYDIFFGGLRMYTEFVKVRTKDGKLGWVNPMVFNDRQVPIRFEETQYNVTPNCPSFFNGLEYFYTGDVLAFLGAQKLRDQIVVAGKKDITRKYNFLKRLKIDKDLKYSITHYIDGSEKRFDVDSTDFDTKYAYDRFLAIELIDPQAINIDNGIASYDDKTTALTIEKLKNFHKQFALNTENTFKTGVPKLLKTQFAKERRQHEIATIQAVPLLLDSDSVVIENNSSSSKQPVASDATAKATKTKVKNDESTNVKRHLINR